MRRQPSSLLLALGLGCGLIALVLALLGAPPTSVAAAPNRSIGTPTPPPSPTPEPTGLPPTATPMPTAPPTATPGPTDPPAATPRPRHRGDPTPTATPAPATATPAPQRHVRVSLHKSIDHDTRAPGQTAVYTLVGRNDGPDTAYDVVISDELPAAVEVIDLSCSKGDVVVRGQTVTAYPSVLAAGESVTVTITVRVRADAAPGAVTNTGTISTSTEDDPGDNASSTTFTIPALSSTVQRLPRTTEAELPGLLALPAWLPWSLVGGLLAMLGIVLRLRGSRQAAESVAIATPNIRPAPPLTFRLPPSRLDVPPRLGPALPPPAPPAPLPPLVPLDRDDALRDAIDGALED